MKRILLPALIAAFVLAGTPAWAGGGATFEFGDRYDRANEYVAVGRRVVGHMDLAFDHRREHMRGPFFAYLRPFSTQWRRPPHIPEGAVLLGRIAIHNVDPGKWTSADARLEFTVPDVAPGRYLIEYCNDPCTYAMGQGDGNWPTFVVVTRSVVEARMRTRLDDATARLESKVYRAKAQAERAERRAEASVDQLSLVEKHTETLQDETEALEATVNRLRATDDDFVPWFAIGVVGLLAAATFLVSRVAKKATGKAARMGEGLAGPEDRDAFRTQPDPVLDDLRGLDRGQLDRAGAAGGEGHDGQRV